MKKSLFFLLGLFIAAICNLNAQQTLATFEDSDSDVLDQLTTGLEVVENPFQTGINDSEKCLKYIRTAGTDWHINDLLSTTAPVSITDENRYLHVMVAADVTLINVLMITGPDLQNMWPAEGGNIEKGYTVLENTWRDFVIDLKGDKIITELSGIYFLGQGWNAAATDINLYYDDILLNNDPLPRATITSAANIADFEHEVSTVFDTYNNGVITETSVVANPEQTGLNKSAKCLHAKTGVAGEWWDGLTLTFSQTILVNDDTRYLHFLLKTDLPKTEINFSPADLWGGSFNPSSDWTEYVIDLHNFNNNNLNGKIVEGFRIVTFPNEEGNHNKDIYIDEIVINDDPTPRTEVGGNGTTNLTDSQAQDSDIYTTANGIFIKEATGNINIYNVNGALVYHTVANGDIAISLEQGLYFVAVNGENYKVFVK